MIDVSPISFAPLTSAERATVTVPRARRSRPVPDAEKIADSIQFLAERDMADPRLDAYLSGCRGIPKPPEGWPEAVGLHHELPEWFNVGSNRPPALLMPKTGPDHAVMGLHAVFLASNGMAKADMPSPKKSWGSGGAVVFRRGGETLFACEGPEDALTAYAATSDGGIICTAGAGTLGRVADFLTPTVSRIVLIADNDQAGRDAAYKVAPDLADRVEVMIALPPDGVKDVNALLQRDGLDAVRAMLEAAERFVPANTNGDNDSGPEAEDGSNGAAGADDAATVKPRFREVAAGVQKFDDRGEPSTWKLFCSPLTVEAETRSSSGEEWGRLLVVTDRDGRRHEWAMPMSMLAGDGTAYRERLLSLGLVLEPGKFARDALHEYINTERSGPRARAVGRIGWQDRAFVLPDRTIGETDGERVLLQTSAGTDHAFRVRGTLQTWQEGVAAHAVGNSRLTFALSAAFASTLLHLTGDESGGYHFRGASSTGKSTALVVAGSVWGGGGLKGYIKQWRLTDNGLESVAAGHCDALLCLDELSQVDAKAAGAAAYMLANGAGKTRAGRGGEGRPAAEWRLIFLSNGEISLADKLAEDGKVRRSMAGQQVRVVDLPADASAGLGLFECLHGFPSADAFARHLKSASGESYGSASRAFIECVVADLDGVREFVAGYVHDFVTEQCPAGADGQVLRVAQRFALVAAAGELAIAYGVLPWPIGEARTGVARCFRDWLMARGGTESAEERDAVSAVRRFLEQHGEGRFTYWTSYDNDSRPTSNRVGFRRVGDQGTEFYILPESWRTEVCAGFDPSMVARVLVSRGYLIPGSDGKPQSKHRLPGLDKPRRVYRIHPSILGGDDA
ncbi:MAG: DUF927 domain-containing protein [Alphaproteobacteria bacterium]|nr:DUF927 domain-containing protein [Alphaproteobacteria bacterium]